MINNSFNGEIIHLNNLIINEHATYLISKEFAYKYCVIPFELKEETLHVAMAAPQDEDIKSCIKLISRKEIKAYKASEEEIVLAIKNSYEKNSTQKSVEDLVLENDSLRKAEKDQYMEMKGIKDAPAVKLTEMIITQALIKNASDIHIEPQEEMVYTRFRRDGVLFDIFKLPRDIYSILSTRIKIMANMDIAEKRSPQDGKVRYKIGDTCYDLRISSLPTIYGEKIVIRILYKSNNFSTVKSLNYSSEDLITIKKILSHNHGIVLVTGPTGSGKSTTLYAMLNELNGRDKNITTIEDPVEITLKGVNQVNVNEKAGITFSNGLRSILRQDPDVIMIGEIRDEDTAAIAVRAAITGHLVLSTLHTNNSIGAINRLVEMGVARYLLADAMVAVIAQRLIRKICPHCKTEYKPSEYEREILHLNESARLFKGKGCFKCSSSGYLGRCSVSEVFYLNNIDKRVLLKENSEELLNNIFKSHNIKSLTDNCKLLVIKGLTSFDELIKISNGEIG